MESKKSLKTLFFFILLETFLVASVVWFFDIFYQYHGPLLGIEPVFYDHTNQMPGSIRNLTYDSVILGTSEAENFNSDIFNELYGCRNIKIIRLAGTTPDMLYYLNISENKHDLKYVFWCFDLFALESTEGVTIFNDKETKYLQTRTIFDDVPYLFNKEVIFREIPTYLAYSYKGIYTGGDAYNWSKGKTFSTATVVGNYGRCYIKKDDINVIPEEDYKEMIDNNIDEVVEYINNHKDTNFIFILPPYSLFWWDFQYVNGFVPMRLYSLEALYESVVGLDNVKVYSFTSDESVALNPDNYMDYLHYSPEINDYMIYTVYSGEREVTTDNYKTYVNDLSEMIDKIESEEIYKYYDVRYPQE